MNPRHLLAWLLVAWLGTAPVAGQDPATGGATGPSATSATSADGSRSSAGDAGADRVDIPGGIRIRDRTGGAGSTGDRFGPEPPPEETASGEEPTGTTLEAARRALSRVEEQRTLSVDFGEGRFRVALAGEVPGGSGATLVPLLRGDLEGVRARCEATSPCRSWISYAPGAPAQPGQAPALALLVESREPARWSFEASGEGLALAGGRGLVLDLGPERPVVVEVGAGLAPLAVTGASTADGGFRGLVGTDGRLGFAWAGEGAALDEVRTELASRLQPPRTLVVDALYRVQPESLSGRLLVRDMDPRPSPVLALPMIGQSEVLAVTDALRGGPVGFRQREGTLVLEPGPGPGPRAFRVEIVAAGPGIETRVLPTLRAPPGRPFVPGFLALDELYPGESGALENVGVSLQDPARQLREQPTLRRFWGEDGYLLFRALTEPARIRLSERAAPADENLLELVASTTLSDDGLELHDLRFTLPSRSRWVEVSLKLPAGAHRLVRWSGEDRSPLALSRPDRGTAADERRPVVRLRVDGRRPVMLQYRRRRRREGGFASLELPWTSQELGKVSWSIQGAAGERLGVPRVEQPSRAAADSSGSRSPFGTSSAGPSGTSMAPSDAGLDEAELGEPAPESTGRVARVNRNTLRAGRVLRVRLAIVDEGRLQRGLLLIFLAGSLAAVWFLLACPLDAGLGSLAGGAVLLAGGLWLARVTAVQSGWFAVLLHGALFAALGAILWWGIRASRGPGVVDRTLEAPSAPQGGAPDAAAHAPREETRGGGPGRDPGPSRKG